ncbi:hypothetical protein [Scleromatobacter humisilvae]|uniref:Uncharacterized protein n=1 Tax=Scleromatobacter humisilvae TaxID=2897159 RepID=A0A9X1YE88_9BURK|nr:hypothetical protein [Scleromatobacter humisilvae]MCK9684614.1 hypothetical protein [Scleromatobacter humisilvae]
MSRTRPVLPLNLLLIGAALLACNAARADDASDCQAAAGSYLTGVVLAAPTFRHGSRLHGIELSHTHVKLIGDADGNKYDIAVDDVFANGYRKRQEAVPAPLDTIKTGDRLSLCGIPYQGGMHWVHTNCGDSPTTQDPDGWLKEIAADGTTGPNLEGSTTYCYLWARK